MDELFHPTFYWACGYVSKMKPGAPFTDMDQIMIASIIKCGVK